VQVKTEGTEPQIAQGDWCQKTKWHLQSLGYVRTASRQLVSLKGGCLKNKWKNGIRKQKIEPHS
jgi:hypothetical protein